VSLRLRCCSLAISTFGESNLKYYTGDTAKLGREGGSFFHMLIEDSSIIKNSADAARYIGMSPSTLKVYVEGGETCGMSFPSKRFEIRVPTASDAGGWPHFLEGGKTAVALEGENAGYLLFATHTNNERQTVARSNEYLGKLRSRTLRSCQNMA
jgi:hypothetical protein